MAEMELARQIAALPVRYGRDGLVLVLLVTSRETGRWVLPKGCPWPHCEEWMSAAEEAREEAGVVGTIHPASIGSYT
jgi:8-oxo-dGTP pyrophosphatase MutT (NUDIX family)